MTKCKNCDKGVILVEYTEYITHDMASDAQDMSLEGQVYGVYQDYEGCQCCNGEWGNCPECTKQEKWEQDHADV